MMQLKPREDFYRQLALMLDAGIGMRQSLAKLAPRAPGPLGQALARIVTAVEGGSPLAEALRASPRGDFGSDEIELLATGELIGKQPETAKRLAESFAFRRALRREVLGALAYPMLLLHAALVIPPLPLLFTTGVGAYCAAAFGGVALLWLFIAGGFTIKKICARSPSASAALESFLLAIPGLGGIFGGLARARWLRALADLHGAGLLAHNALEAAARASGSATLQARLAPAAVAVAAGTPMTEAIEATGVLDATTLAILETGEMAGRFDEVVGKVADEAADSAKRRTRALSRVATAGVYVLAAIYVAVNVIGFYVGMYSDAIKALG